MRIRILPLLLLSLAMIAIPACKKDKKQWTLQQMEGTLETATFKVNLKLLDSIQDEPEFSSPADGKFELMPISLTLGDGGKEITLRVEKEYMNFFEVRLKQVEKLKDGTLLFELVENPTRLQVPEDSDFVIEFLVNPTKTCPLSGNGRNSAQFSPEEGSVLAKFYAELIYTPKPGVKKEKQRYGGELIYYIRK